MKIFDLKKYLVPMSSKMSFSLTRLNFARNVKTRVFTDPTQYDTEINAARGLNRKPIRSKSTSDAREAIEVPHLSVTETEVIDAQNFWAQSIVDISNAFLSGEDYATLASERAGELYGYKYANVLFKPTKAAQQQFRPTAGDAMSYFIGHDAVINGYKEDQGFAINAKKGFSQVVFENHQIDCHGDVAHAMGTYEFTCATTGEISSVEYTFGYKRLDGKVRIYLHHSSIPYESGNNQPSRARGQKSLAKRKIIVDPDQYDTEANEGRTLQ